MMEFDDVILKKSELDNSQMALVFLLREILKKVK